MTESFVSPIHKNIVEELHNREEALVYKDRTIDKESTFYKFQSKTP